ncbi:MAG: hypothetical protein M3014_12620 [Chloroflexota bacterium]|nr:hypothetical protein [Chloroflexota bacterium]
MKIVPALIPSPDCCSLFAEERRWYIDQDWNISQAIVAPIKRGGQAEQVIYRLSQPLPMASTKIKARK